jgi:exodeoxyribonuclease V alpha subunit
MKNSIINTLYQKEIFSRINIHFARFIADLCGDGDPDIFLAAALVSRAAENGDVCIDLHDSAERVILENQNGNDGLICPKLDRWLEKIGAAPVTGRPGQRKPLILDTRNRLYLYRNWEYENILADDIKSRANDETSDLDIKNLIRSIIKLYPKEKGGIPDWQKIAAVTALLKKICIITGGPGTGKTFTITKIMALLIEQGFPNNPKIFLAAPTGKAATRLQESIRQAIPELNCSDNIKNAIPIDVKTIHRMLRPKLNSPYFHYNRKNTLPADMVIVDEASMVDLALMSKLVQAIPMNARLVLIGDKDQLASVEAGSVLGDICDRDNLHGFSREFCKQILQIANEDLSTVIDKPSSCPGLQDCIVVLRISHRFTADSGIGGLSRAVNRGNADKVFQLIEDAPDPSIVWHEMGNAPEFFNLLAQRLIEGYREYLSSADPLSALEWLSRFKILCALRIGPFGATAINRLAEQVLSQHGLIQFDLNYSNPWYGGRPILITRNDYNLGLFNGDIGVTLPDADASSAALYVFFPAADGGFRRYAIHRLPEHETVFAMTVHKSQGSEFDEVGLILPNKDYPVLTRELVYTGLTRAKKKFTVWAHESVLRNTISRRINRISGLREALWG